MDWTRQMDSCATNTLVHCRMLSILVDWTNHLPSYEEFTRNPPRWLYTRCMCSHVVKCFLTDSILTGNLVSFVFLQTSWAIYSSELVLDCIDCSWYPQCNLCFRTTPYERNLWQSWLALAFPNRGKLMLILQSQRYMLTILIGYLHDVGWYPGIRTYASLSHSNKELVQGQKGVVQWEVFQILPIVAWSR